MNRLSATGRSRGKDIGTTCFSGRIQVQVPVDPGNTVVTRLNLGYPANRPF